MQGKGGSGDDCNNLYQVPRGWARLTLEKGKSGAISGKSIDCVKTLFWFRLFIADVDSKYLRFLGTFGLVIASLLLRVPSL